MGERRFDPTTGEWVTFSTARQERIYQPDPGACPLCPTRPGGPATEVPRPHFEIAVFENRFPALTAAPGRPSVAGTALTPVEPALGVCEVVVYTDDHHASLATVGEPRVRLLMEAWAHRTAALGARDGIDYVMPFENKGEVVGVTLSHPHGQIFGFPDIPPRPLRELQTARAYHDRHGRCVWCDLVAQEAAGPRVVAESGRWLAVVPFWARWPYQVEIWARGHDADLVTTGRAGRRDLAAVLTEVLGAYDGLFGFSLPYVLGVHQRPTDGGDWDAVAHVHVELDPPHRSVAKRKFLAGTETIGGAFLTDVAPEAAAAHLRAATPGGR